MVPERVGNVGEAETMEVRDRLFSCKQQVERVDWKWDMATDSQNLSPVTHPPARLTLWRFHNPSDSTANWRPSVQIPWPGRGGAGGVVAHSNHNKQL